ncbi:MAG: stimulus-sensing domain-containing protein, partial [Methyloligellaceae bacterium]
MADDLPRPSNDATAESGPARALRSLRRIFEWFEARFPFGSVTRRIVILNLFGLAILVSGILFLNQFRAGLIDAKVQSLQTQGEIIAEAIASAAAIDTDRVPLDNDQVLELDAGTTLGNRDDELAALEFPINPELAAPKLGPLVAPTGTRARIYNRDGALILDSDTLYSRGQILRYELPPPGEEKTHPIVAYWSKMRSWLWRQDLPLYKEIGGENGKAYPEVASALTGTSVPIVRVNEKGELVVSVA